MERFCRLISDHIGLLVLSAAVVAYAFPALTDGVSPSVINPLLGIIMFGMGMTLRAADFRVVFSRPKDVLIGCVAQFTVMPLLAWSLSRLFGLDEALTIGVVLVGCCPGGTASNVITYLSGGDLALSVGMTGVSTLLAPLLTPLLVLLLAGKTVAVDVTAMMVSILWVVIVPIVCGLMARRLMPDLTARSARFLPALSSLTIAAIVMIIIGANAPKLAAAGAVVAAVVILHNVCGLALGYLIARLMHMSSPKRKALSIEVGMQNSGLASSLATLHFASFPMATIPGALFSVWHNLSGALMVRIFVERGEKACVRKTDLN